MCKAVERKALLHVADRKQFGVAIGSFQAVQHALADMHVWVEAMDSLALFAAWALDNSPEQREFAAAAATRIALQKGMFFLERAIQVHGGIGFTWEYDIHLYLRRLMLFRALLKPGAEQDSRLLALARKL
jgi:alkylation response protein AidB-like acyl-CoA dehydrogenase